MGQAMEVADVKADAAAAAHGGADCPAPSRRPYLGLSGVLLAALLVAAGVPAALPGWRQTGLPDREAPDKYLYDLHQVWLAKQEQTARPELALIAITERTIADYAAQQPVDRGLLAQLTVLA